jgi:hypothetical protein
VTDKLACLSADHLLFACVGGDERVKNEYRLCEQIKRIMLARLLCGSFQEQEDTGEWIDGVCVCITQTWSTVAIGFCVVPHTGKHGQGLE